jgi:hypothetical protein
MATTVAFSLNANAGGELSIATDSPINVCSRLNFNGIIWPTTLALQERSLMDAALNLSGLYEGNGGWATLTNDFDGQGLSMGLLNQNLGQGSLQPMLTEMQAQYPKAFQAQFSKANYTNITGMLKSWEGSVSAQALDIKEYGYSKLDDPEIVAQEMGVQPSLMQEISLTLASRDSRSVNWAVANLYKSKAFKTDWFKSLTALAITGEYRGIQVEKAIVLHREAVALMKSTGFTSLRAYLFMYDIVVQNGGLSSYVLNGYKAWKSKNTKATEVQKLKKILALRLAAVRKQYRADVSARKLAIINGTGTVHGAKIDLSSLFCLNLSDSVL